MIPIYAPTRENELRMREHHRQQVDVDVKRLMMRQPPTMQYGYGLAPGTDLPDIEAPGRAIFLLVKTDAAHAKGASGTCSIYAGATKGSEADTGENITAWNRFADLASGKWAVAVYIGNGYDLIAGEC